MQLKKLTLILLGGLAAVLALVFAVSVVTAGENDPMASSVNIVGAYDNTLTDTVTIKWYSNGVLKKTSTKTVRGGETTSIWVPNELSGISVPDRIMAVISTTKPVNVVIAASNQGNNNPTKGQAYRAMSKEATWQQDVADVLWAPILWKYYGSGKYTSHFVLTHSYSEYSPGYLYPVTVKITYYDATTGQSKGGQEVSVYPRTVNIVKLPTTLDDGRYTAQLDASGNFPYLQGIVITEKTSDGKRMFDYPLRSKPGTYGYAARVMGGTASLAWYSAVYIMDTSTVTATGDIGFCRDGSTYCSYDEFLIPPKALNKFTYNCACEGAVRIISDNGNDLVAMVLGEGDSYEAQAAYALDFDENEVGKYGWYAHNTWNYYGWDCATPGQNLDSEDWLSTTWRYPGGFKQTTVYNIAAFHKYLFLNDVLPNNVVAGARVASSAGQLAQVGQCLNDDDPNAAFVSAEGSIMNEDETTGMIVIAPLVWTGQ